MHHSKTHAIAIASLLAAGLARAGEPVEPVAGGPALEIEGQSVRYVEALDVLVFEQRLAGTAGGIVPEPAGGLDGAPVLGYVFPTTLSPTAVGFGEIDGILALAATSHPDFDDTPLWDEGVTGRAGDPMRGDRWTVGAGDRQAYSPASSLTCAARLYRRSQAASRSSSSSPAASSANTGYRSSSLATSR